MMSKDFSRPDNAAERTLAWMDFRFRWRRRTGCRWSGPVAGGKSTLLRLIADSDSPDSGDLLVDRNGLLGRAWSEGWFFQDPNLFPWLTVRGNIQPAWLRAGLLLTASRPRGW